LAESGTYERMLQEVAYKYSLDAFKVLIENAYFRKTLIFAIDKILLDFVYSSRTKAHAGEKYSNATLNQIHYLTKIACMIRYIFMYKGTSKDDVAECKELMARVKAKYYDIFKPTKEE